MLHVNLLDILPNTYSRPLELRESNNLDCDIEPLDLDDSASENEFNFKLEPQKNESNEQPLENPNLQPKAKVRLIKEFLDLQLGLS